MQSCHQCGDTVKKKPSEAAPKGRPWKHAFCDASCHNKWRADQHNATKRKWLIFQREVWGTTEIERFEVGKSKAVGRIAEINALSSILPNLGFSEIDDFSNYSNQFFVDFIATYNGERVLVDSTIKLKAYIPEKAYLARSLRMRLFILHVSLKNPNLYWLNEVPDGRVVVRVPAQYLREHVPK